MSVHVFRVIVRGRFDGLDDDQRATLLASAGDHDMTSGQLFTIGGTLTYDRRLDFFSYRVESRVDTDEPATAEATALGHAVDVATEDLVRRGLPWHDLRATGTDMASMWDRTRRRR